MLHLKRADEKNGQRGGGGGGGRGLLSSGSRQPGRSEEDRPNRHQRTPRGFGRSPWPVLRLTRSVAARLRRLPFPRGRYGGRHPVANGDSGTEEPCPDGAESQGGA